MRVERLITKCMKWFVNAIIITIIINEPKKICIVVKVFEL